jgi:hypothetical protein
MGSILERAEDVTVRFLVDPVRVVTKYFNVLYASRH